MNISGYMEGFWPYETDLKNAREKLAQTRVPDGFAVTVPVSEGDAFDEKSIVLIKESLAQLGIKLTLPKMSIRQKSSLLRFRHKTQLCRVSPYLAKTSWRVPTADGASLSFAPNSSEYSAR